MTGNNYPSDWPQVADEIKAQSGWKCENCGESHNPETGYCLTVHHLNGVKSDCRYENLVALCQRCHLHIQGRYYPGQQAFWPYPWAEKRGLM